MNDKFKFDFEQERSNEVELVASNLEAILKSSTYKLAHEDIELLNTDEMRGVRMLLEITKPEQVIEKENIISTVIVFGGVHISEEIASKRRLDDAEKLLSSNPKSKSLKINFERLKNLYSLSHYYSAARELSKLISLDSKTKNPYSHVIVTGGGPGIMEAANRGAFDAGCKSIGLNISLPNEQHPNSFITPGLCFKFNYFAMRKFHFVMRSAAAVFFPGGFGTLDELFELLTLRQTGMKKDIPIILFGRSYWEKVINFQFLSDMGLIGENDLSIFQYADTANEAWNLIKNFTYTN
ncbi:MAG: LOG family protein [Prochlorococcus marinus CUG1431]|uniref:LOG family protein n=1 Tax=Prochlorococcus marinus CUG1433 TaxID=2774506 RepID=A0A9D9G1C0_PROMR|nr:LOG family protein [Prochlorococcus marinus CUG1433]MBO6981394.1 LOG family protein [Prochlorococcus marinus CUG1431]